MSLHLDSRTFHSLARYLGSKFTIILQNGMKMDPSYGYEDCIGLRVKPRKGDGLLFYTLFPNGTIDPVSIFPHRLGYPNF